MLWVFFIIIFLLFPIPMIVIGIIMLVIKAISGVMK